MAVAEPVASPRESFAALLHESLGVASGLEGTVVKGRVIAIENDAALIDVGLKSEGRVALKEFSVGGQPPDIHVGDTVEVFLERMEDKNGEAALSREKARFVRRIRQLLTLEAQSDEEFCEMHSAREDRLLQAALGQLTELEREAFVLYELEGQGGVELAAIFGCPETTVYRRLHDARKKFQAYITKEARS